MRSVGSVLFIKSCALYFQSWSSFLCCVWNFNKALIRLHLGLCCVHGWILSSPNQAWHRGKICCRNIVLNISCNILVLLSRNENIFIVKTFLIVGIIFIYIWDQNHVCWKMTVIDIGLIQRKSCRSLGNYCRAMLFESSNLPGVEPRQNT